MNYLILLPVLLPLFGGVALKFLSKSTREMRVFSFAVALITAAAVWALSLFAQDKSFVLLRFTRDLTLAFRIDGVSSVFAMMSATLWPFALLYAFEYMEHDARQVQFFTFFVASFGVTMGIAFAANLMTLFVFYEMLTLATLPLVIHSYTHEANAAGRKYLFMSLFGSALVFIGLLFILFYGGTDGFTYGGVFNADENRNLLRIAYLVCFIGFGVKAAVWPLHVWLPDAAVAPTPVTALLHAVAVVKAGVFGIIRITYFSFGIELLSGSFAQYAVMGIALFTILFGSTTALREPHLKRRLAYSTVSNLSYILFAASLCSPAGLAAALVHMVAHSVTKICAFFCVGSVVERSGREYIQDIGGLAKKMPVTFAAFTFSALSIIGIPPFCGFIGKWSIASAAFESGNVLAYIGVGVLLLSALLTAIYMMSIVVKAYSPSEERFEGVYERKTRPMALTSVFFAGASLALGLFASPLVEIVRRIAEGGF